MAQRGGAAAEHSQALPDFAMMDSMKKLLIASIPLFFLVTAQAQELPDGPGKDTFVMVCGACHDAGVVATMFLSRDDWQNTVDDMKGRGADGTDAQFKTILDYLSKYQGPQINVNKASAMDLSKQFGLTDQEAQAVVAYRMSNGDFKQWDDLAKVSGLDIKKIEPLKPRILFSDPGAAGAPNASGPNAAH